MAEKEARSKEKDINLVLNMMDKADLIRLSNKIVDFLKDKHGLSLNDIIGDKADKSNIVVPVTVFATKLSPSEALVKFLKDTYDMSFTDIAEATKKETSSIWSSYKRASKKVKQGFKFEDSDVLIPLSAFGYNLSILESLASYMKDEYGMKMSKLCSLINKNKSTLWTAYNRAKSKKGGKK